jgi:membrane protease YdiL (CAAX protease family)
MKTRIIQSDPHEPQSAGAGLPAGAAVAVRRSGLTAFVRRHPLLVFFVLAFAITWAPTPFGIFMAAGPLVAAVIVTAVVGGRRGLRELGSRMIRWRVGWQWYAAALLIPLAVVLGTGGLTVALGAPDSAIRDLELSALVLAFALRLVVPIFSPIGEEPGWRGFALPRLLADRSPFEVTLFLGLIVAVWHVPLIFIAEEDLPAIFLLTTVAVTFFYTWLFIHSGGSVFITILAHATEGLISREFVGTDGFVGGDETNWTLLYTAGWCAVAIGLLVFDQKLWRDRAPAPARATSSTAVSAASEA